MLNGFYNIDGNRFALYRLEGNLIDDCIWVCAVRFAIICTINMTEISCLSSSKNMGVFLDFGENGCSLLRNVLSVV
jgi:hypothetical protein